MNYIISNACESRSNTGYALAIKDMYMWQLKGTVSFFAGNFLLSLLC